MQPSPVRHGPFHYYTRFEEGKSYPIHCRTPADSVGANSKAKEEVLFNVNEMAKGHGYFSLGSLDPSPNHKMIAYASDNVGRRICDIHIKNLTTGETGDHITQVSGNLEWAEDGRHLFYARRDLETLRTYQIWRHEVGTDAADDQLVFQEDDEIFSCGISKTTSRRFLTITSNQTLTTEVRILDASDPLGEWQVVLPRERGHEYHVAHHGDSLYFMTNRDATNFRLTRAPVTAPNQWTDVIPHRADVLLEDVAMFAGYMVVAERHTGLRRLRVHTMAGDGTGPTGSVHDIRFADPTYAVYPGTNPEFETTTLRFNYSSLTVPASVYDLDMRTHEQTLMKREEIRGGFDSANYTSERLWATAQDGTKVPISLVHRNPLVRDGKRPLLLYAYGSYGSSMEARFSASTVSLLDRGFVYAIAHVRGGQELGRSWYEDGKLMHKKNTFSDFIACGEELVKSGYTSPERLCAKGGSAGGLLMGAITNMRPNLFAGVVAAVPFVDVVTTMLDASIPLTTFEWDEWGDPRERAAFEYMLSYSPYDQVEAKEYPDLLVTTGLHDSQVQYWEPAKWVAKLRAMKTDTNRLVFDCEMEAGHGGASGRYDRYRKTALEYAFLLTAVR